MSEVVVVGSFKAEPGKEAEALQAFKDLVGPTHAEDGCIMYALHQGADDPSQLAFIERWASREALNAHLAGAARRGDPRARAGAVRRERVDHGLRRRARGGREAGRARRLDLAVNPA